MASRPTIKFGVKISQYAALHTLAAQVITNMTTNVASFPTPVPALATVTTDNTNLQNAITAWGPVGSRGAHSDLVALRAAARVVYNDLLLLAAYVQNLVDLTLPYVDQADFILLSGFPIKNSPTPQGVLGAPQSFRQLFSNTVSVYTPKLKWKKPLGLLSAGNVKSYKVLRSTTNSIVTAVVIATVTNTTYTDMSAPLGATAWYFVIATNTVGDGVASASCPIPL